MRVTLAWTLRFMRPMWEELPEALRSSVEAVLGLQVVSALSEPGGFSPGVAAFAGLMQHSRRQPAPPHMTSIREHQGSQGDVALAWLRVRTGWA